MKVAIVGAGSTYTPELIEGLLDRRSNLQIDCLSLQDIDVSRLSTLAGMVQRMVEYAGSSMRVSSTTDLREAVSGASIVVLQIRVGQSHARIRDESIPTQLGLIGQETTGAGGFAKALRTVPVALDIAETVREHAEDAWIIAFTNPVGMVTRALLEAGHRAIGLCNVANSFRRTVSRLLDAPAQRVTFDHAGLNHLTWIQSVKVDGIERMGELLENPLRDEIAADIGLRSDTIAALKCIPSYYLKYFYDTQKCYEEQRRSPRGMEVQSVEAQLLQLYTKQTTVTKPALLESRGGAFYSEAAASLIESLQTGDGDRHYLNIRNAGGIAGLPENAVVEVPVTVDRSGARSAGIIELPPEALTLTRMITEYEQTTLEAIHRRDLELAIEALGLHPLVATREAASQLLKEFRRQDPWISNLFDRTSPS